MGRPKAPSPTQVPTLDPQQTQLLTQLLSGIGPQLGGAFGAIETQLDPAQQTAFFQQAVAEPSIEQFQSQVIPSILQAQASLGAKGGTSIERQLAQAGRSLETDLARQLAGFQVGQQQAGVGNIASLLGLGLGTQPFALQQQAPRGPGLGEQALGSFIQTLPFLLL